LRVFDGKVNRPKGKERRKRTDTAKIGEREQAIIEHKR